MSAIEWFNAANHWLLAQRYELSPLALYGLVCIGWILRGWRIKRAKR